MKLSAKQQRIWRRIQRKYNVSEAFIRYNMMNIRKFIYYAMCPRLIIKRMAVRRQPHQRIVIEHYRLRRVLFDQSLLKIIKRRKHNVKQWSRSMVQYLRRTFGTLEYCEEEEEEEESLTSNATLSKDELTKQLKEQIELLKSGKRAVPLIENTTDQKQDVTKQQSDVEKTEITQYQLLLETTPERPICAVAQPLKRSMPTVGSVEVKEENAQKSTNQPTLTGKSNFLDMLMRKVQVTAQEQICIKNAVEVKIERENSMSPTEDFAGFEEEDTTSRSAMLQLATPTVRSNNSAFISEALDNYLLTINLLNKNETDKCTTSSNQPITKKKYLAFDKCEGLVTPDCIPPYMDKPLVPESLQRLRTVAERRQYLQKFSHKPELSIINNEAAIYRELQRKSRRKLSSRLSMQGTQVQIPFTRTGWRAASFLSTDYNKYYYQILPVQDNNELLYMRLNGLTGNNDELYLPHYKSSYKPVHITCTTNCLDAHIFSELKVLSPPCQRAKLNNTPLPYALPPCPLSKKPFQKPLDEETAPLLRAGGNIVVVRMPTVELQVFPERGKPLNEVAKGYLRYVMPYQGITREWAEFSVSTLQQPKPELSKKRNSFAFAIPYVNDRSQILARRMVDRSEKMDKSFEAVALGLEPPQAAVTDLSFRAHIDTTNEQLVACADVVSDLINSVAISCSENSFINDDPDLNYGTEITEQQDVITNRSRFSTVTAVNHKHHDHKHNKKQSRMLNELRRLNATIIDAAVQAENYGEQTCKYEFCKLGCVCSSLNEQYPLRQHCGKSRCIIDCICKSGPQGRVMRLDADGRTLTPEDAFLLRRQATARLARMEKEFTSTIVLTENEMLLINESQYDKKRRCTKVPKRYEDYADAADNDNSVDYITSPVKKSTSALNRNSSLESFDSVSTLQNNQILRETVYVKESVLQQLKHCSVPLLPLPIAHKMATWCMVHELYQCFCGGFATKGEPLLLKTENGLTSSKSMDNMKTIKPAEVKILPNNQAPKTRYCFDKHEKPKVKKLEPLENRISKELITIEKEDTNYSDAEREEDLAQMSDESYNVQTVRKRGRPRLLRSPTELNVKHNDETEQIPRKRGRPRLTPIIDSTEKVVPKKRGRPPLVRPHSESDIEMSDQSSEKASLSDQILLKTADVPSQSDVEVINQNTEKTVLKKKMPYKGKHSVPELFSDNSNNCTITEQILDKRECLSPKTEYMESRPDTCRRAIVIPAVAYQLHNQSQVEHVYKFKRDTETESSNLLLEEHTMNSIGFYKKRERLRIALQKFKTKINAQQQSGKTDIKRNWSISREPKNIIDEENDTPPTKRVKYVTSMEMESVILSDDDDYHNPELVSKEPAQKLRAKPQNERLVETETEATKIPAPVKNLRKITNSNSSYSNSNLISHLEKERTEEITNFQQIGNCIALNANATTEANKMSPAIRKDLQLGPENLSIDNKLLKDINMDVMKYMNALVRKKMQDIDLALRRVSKCIPTPNNDVLSMIPWNNFLAAYKEKEIYIWLVKLCDSSFLAATILNITPIVVGTIAVQNIAYVRETELPLMARMLVKGTSKQSTEKLAIIMQGRAQYWHIKGFLRPDEKSVCCKPTPETHPVLTNKISLLFRLLLKRRIKNFEKQLQQQQQQQQQSLNNKSEILNTQPPLDLARSVLTKASDPLISSANGLNKNMNNQLIDNNSCLFNLCGAEISPITNLQIRRVKPDDITEFQQPENIAHDHRWLVLDLYNDFSHIFVADCQDFVTMERIQDAMIASKNRGKNVQLQLKNSAYNFYVTPASKRKLYFGPISINTEKLPILMLVQSVDGKLMLRELYQKIIHIQPNPLERTTAFWVFQLNGELFFEYNLNENEAKITNAAQNTVPPLVPIIAGNTTTSIIQESLLKQQNNSTNKVVANDDDDDDCLIIEDDNLTTTTSQTPETNNKPMFTFTIQAPKSVAISSTTNKLTTTNKITAPYFVPLVLPVTQPINTLTADNTIQTQKTPIQLPPSLVPIITNNYIKTVDNVQDMSKISLENQSNNLKTNNKELEAVSGNTEIKIPKVEIEENESSDDDDEEFIMETNNINIDKSLLNLVHKTIPSTAVSMTTISTATTNTPYNTTTSAPISQILKPRVVYIKDLNAITSPIPATVPKATNITTFDPVIKKNLKPPVKISTHQRISKPTIVNSEPKRLIGKLPVSTNAINLKYTTITTVPTSAKPKTTTSNGTIATVSMLEKPKTTTSNGTIATVSMPAKANTTTNNEIITTLPTLAKPKTTTSNATITTLPTLPTLAKPNTTSNIGIIKTLPTVAKPKPATSIGTITLPTLSKPKTTSNNATITTLPTLAKPKTTSSNGTITTLENAPISVSPITLGGVSNRLNFHSCFIKNNEDASTTAKPTTTQINSRSTIKDLLLGKMINPYNVKDNNTSNNKPVEINANKLNASEKTTSLEIQSIAPKPIIKIKHLIKQPHVATVAKEKQPSQSQPQPSIITPTSPQTGYFISPNSHLPIFAAIKSAASEFKIKIAGIGVVRIKGERNAINYLNYYLKSERMAPDVKDVLPANWCFQPHSKTTQTSEINKVPNITESPNAKSTKYVTILPKPTIPVQQTAASNFRKLPTAQNLSITFDGIAPNNNDTIIIED